MDLYSRLMGIDEVVEYLSDKTDRDFNKDKTIKFIEEKKIPIVFEYKGWGTYEFEYEREYLSLNIEVDGYFGFKNASDAIHIFKGFLSEIAIHEAIIYHLNSCRIRSNAPDVIEPKEGDNILLKTGGRSPMFSHPNTQNFIRIDNNKVGVLRVDLEEYIDNETKIETLEPEIERLKNENTILVQQHTETLTAANTEIADLENRLAQAKVALADMPADDLKIISHQSHRTVDKVMYAMAKITGLDNSKPYSQNTPSLNAAITTILQNDSLPLEYEAVGKWLSRINDIKPLK